ncbi:MAG: hypothetical protein KGM17_09610 [Sphingomonadales bacterium]|nr:hypothetical protein [Sphingomonadales bacterium]
MPRPRRSLLEKFNPTDAIGDFVAVWRDAGRHRWKFLLAAIGTTALVFSLVVWEEHRIPPRPPQIVWINSWRADRSDAEIKATNLEYQRRKDAEQAAEARNAEEVRQIYKTLGRLSGMDVDAIERRAKAEQAASAAAAEAERQRQETLRHAFDRPAPKP